MFKVKIITPQGVYGEADASILNVRTTDGMRGILSNHMPLVTMLVDGEMTVGNDQANTRVNYHTGQGILYFHDNLATVLVDSIEEK